MKRSALCLVYLIVSISVMAKVDTLPSKVYYLAKAKPTSKNGQPGKLLVKGSTLDLEELTIHTSSLKAGQSDMTHIKHNGFDELVIVKEGNLRVSVRDSSREMGAGSIAYLLAGDQHSFKNISDQPVTYYILTFNPRNKNERTGNEHSVSVMMDWKELEVRKTDKGESRPMFDIKTWLFQRFDMHATSLDPGFASHAAHTHRSEEIILMIKGNGESQIGNGFHKASAGDVILLRSNVPHAFKNTGDWQCSYFAIQWRN